MIKKLLSAFCWLLLPLKEVLCVLYLVLFIRGQCVYSLKSLSKLYLHDLGYLDIIYF